MTRRSRASIVALGLGSLLLLAAIPTACAANGKSASGAPGTPPPLAEPPSRRALIVAISDYAPETGWWSISSDRDVALVRTALQGQGISAIEVLSGERATRKGIVEAFRRFLIEPARRGDLVVFHYSGHGQQITDDGADEPDGYDEAIVPYDAPLDLTSGYRGDRHLRDDELHGLIQELRLKVGPEGHVVVFLDTCFSGTPRGRRELQRGWQPLGPPAAGRSGREQGSGFYEALSARGRRTASAGEDEMAPFVIFSAARHNEVAAETLGDDGRTVGSLTYAVTHELSRLSPEPKPALPRPEVTVDAGSQQLPGVSSALPPTGSSVSPDEQRDWTYRRFYERIRWVMAGLVSNQPQVEGDVDSLVFGGRLVVPEPYVEVTSVSEDASTLELAAGALAGLLAGTRIEVHREGTLRPSPESRLVSGTVVKSTWAEAVVNFAADAAGEVDRSELEQGRAFITHHVFGPLRVTVQFVGLEPKLAARLTNLLTERVSAVELVVEGGELVIRAEETAGLKEARVTVETAAGSIVVLPPTPVSTPKLEERIGRRLLDYARNRYFRKLRLEDPALRVELEIVPVRGLGCQGEPSDPSTCINFEDVEPAAGPRLWRPGDLYRLQVVHRGTSSAHLNILDLQPDGVIRLFWPTEEARDQTALAPSLTWKLPEVFMVTEPAGIELLLLIASEEWIDLSPFVTRDELLGGTPRGDFGPFTPLFDDVAARSRSAPTYPGGVHTSAVTMTTVTEDAAAENRSQSAGSGQEKDPP